MVKNSKLPLVGSAGCSNNLHYFFKPLKSEGRMKRSYVLWCLLTAVSFSCNQSPGTDASSIVPSVTKKSQPADDFRIYSDPKASKITIVFNSKETGQAMLSVYYPDGKLYSRKTLYVNKGMNSWDYQFTYRASGAFIIAFLMKDIHRTGRVFKAS